MKFRFHILRPLALAALSLAFAPSAYGQKFLQDYDYQLSLVESEGAPAAKIARIDSFVRKVVDGYIGDRAINKLEFLIKMREAECKKSPGACTDFTAWFSTLCAKSSKVLDPAQRLLMWDHVAARAKSEPMILALTKQVQTACKKTGGIQSFRGAFEFEKYIASRNRTAILHWSKWTLATWQIPPVPEEAGLELLASTFEQAETSKPVNAHLMKAMAQLTGQWILSNKLTPRAAEEALNIALRGLAGANMLNEVIALTKHPVLASNIRTKSGFAARNSDILCEVWLKAGAGSACDALLQNMKPEHLTGPTKKRVAVAIFQQHYYRGRLKEAEAAVRGLMNVSSGQSDPYTGFLRFLLAVVLQDQGRYKEAAQSIAERYEIDKRAAEELSILKVTTDNLRASILTKEKKFAEARAISDRCVRDIDKVVWGPHEVAAWVYYGRLKLTVLMGDKKEAALTKAHLKSALNEMPGLGFLGDLAEYWLAPDSPAGKAGLDRARKLLGAEYPLIREAAARVQPPADVGTTSNSK